MLQLRDLDGFALNGTLATVHSRLPINPPIDVPTTVSTDVPTCIYRSTYSPTDLPTSQHTYAALSLYRFALVYSEKVKDGPWAYTEIPKVKDGNPGSLNADVYGKQRSRWNLNDRPWVRFTTAILFLIYIRAMFYAFVRVVARGIREIPG